MATRKKRTVRKKTSPGVQKALWKMMTDRKFRKAMASGKTREAVAASGLKLSKTDIVTLSKIDPKDLESVVARFEKDITLVMGGSRPRRAVALSNSTIKELRKALKEE